MFASARDNCANNRARTLDHVLLSHGWARCAGRRVCADCAAGPPSILRGGQAPPLRGEWTGAEHNGTPKAFQVTTVPTLYVCDNSVCVLLIAIACAMVLRKSHRQLGSRQHGGAQVAADGRAASQTPQQLFSDLRRALGEDASTPEVILESPDSGASASGRYQVYEWADLSVRTTASASQIIEALGVAATLRAKVNEGLPKRLRLPAGMTGSSVSATTVFLLCALQMLLATL